MSTSEKMTSPLGVDGHAVEGVQLELGGRPGPAVAGVVVVHVPCDRVDAPRLHCHGEDRPGHRRDEPDEVVAGVGHDDVALRVEGDPVGRGEPGREGRPAGRDLTFLATAGDGVDPARRHLLSVAEAPDGCHEADGVVAGVGDGQVAVGVDGDAVGARELGGGEGTGAPVADVPVGPVAHDGVDVSGGHGVAPEGAGGRGRHPDDVVVLVGEDHVAVPVVGPGEGGPQGGREARPSAPDPGGGPAPGDGGDLVGPSGGRRGRNNPDQRRPGDDRAHHSCNHS